MQPLTSFNEPHVSVMFDAVKHEYWHGRKQLKAASSFLYDYEDQFDSERISARCADNWDVDQDDLLKMWGSNGNAASGFGTALHAVLEHYFTHKTLGAKVQKEKGTPYNAALPNHPFLRQLIGELEKIRTDGDTRQEALVTAVKKGRCGLIDDLLITGEKTCRVRDYKITYDIVEPGKKLASPFDYLPAMKLSKNYVQLAFYSYLLLLSGWKVEGVDVFNWDGEWHVHTMEGKELAKLMLLVGGEIKKI